jgi:hypothetical protein
VTEAKPKPKQVIATHARFVIRRDARVIRGPWSEQWQAERAAAQIGGDVEPADEPYWYVPKVGVIPE